MGSQCVSDTHQKWFGGKLPISPQSISSVLLWLWNSFRGNDSPKNEQLSSFRLEVMLSTTKLFFVAVQQSNVAKILKTATCFKTSSIKRLQTSNIFQISSNWCWNASFTSFIVELMTHISTVRNSAWIKAEKVFYRAIWDLTGQLDDGSHALSHVLIYLTIWRNKNSYTIAFWWWTNVTQHPI